MRASKAILAQVDVPEGLQGSIFEGISALVHTVSNMGS